MGVHLKEGQLFPDHPVFAEADFDRAKATGNAMHLLFEWYKWTGLVSNQIASLDPASPGYRALPRVETAALRGLMNRASRLMVANLRLASLQKHAEAILLLNRSICETAIVVQWLCHSGSGDAFRRYLAKGLDAELRLKVNIEENIRSREGQALVIEKRMLTAIAKLCELAQLSENDVRSTKPLPDFASMLRTLGHDDLSYTIMQRLGSHAVHGTWPDLLFHYLDLENDAFVLTDNVIAPEGTEFVASATVVLEAVAAFARFVVLDEEFAADIAQIAQDAIAEIVRIHRLASGDDYSAA
ncbi:MAG: DUF5677 domain-containing protein [Acidobacteriota bacterium]|nr:DUF5677 domain-containing protein [Acidobacteriota bacterium]